MVAFKCIFIYLCTRIFVVQHPRNTGSNSNNDNIIVSTNNNIKLNKLFHWSIISHMTLMISHQALRQFVCLSVFLSVHLSPICFYIRLFLYQSIYLATVTAAIDIYMFFSSCWFLQCFSQSVHRFVHLLHSGSKPIFYGKTFDNVFDMHKSQFSSENRKIFN